MSQNKQSKRGPKPVKRNKVLLKLRTKKRATSAALRASTAFMTSLEKSGFVTVADVADPRGKTGRGRKANVYRLTSRGNGKASSLLRAKAA